MKIFINMEGKGGKSEDFVHYKRKGSERVIEGVKRVETAALGTSESRLMKNEKKC